MSNLASAPVAAPTLLKPRTECWLLMNWMHFFSFMIVNVWNTTGHSDLIVLCSVLCSSVYWINKTCPCLSAALYTTLFLFVSFDSSLLAPQVPFKTQLDSFSFYSQRKVVFALISFQQQHFSLFRAKQRVKKFLVFLDRQDRQKGNNLSDISVVCIIVILKYIKWHWHHNHSCCPTTHPSHWTFNTKAHQNWKGSLEVSAAGSECDLWCWSARVKATRGSRVAVWDGASHQLPFWRWDFLHSSLLPANSKPICWGLKSKMALTPINIVTAHKQVQRHAHTGTHSIAGTHKHKHTHIGRHTRADTSVCHPYVLATCPLPDIRPW